MKNTFYIKIFCSVVFVFKINYYKASEKQREFLIECVSSDKKNTDSIYSDDNSVNNTQKKHSKYFLIKNLLGCRKIKKSNNTHNNNISHNFSETSKYDCQSMTNEFNQLILNKNNYNNSSNTPKVYRRSYSMKNLLDCRNTNINKNNERSDSDMFQSLSQASEYNLKLEGDTDNDEFKSCLSSFKLSETEKSEYFSDYKECENLETSQSEFFYSCKTSIIETQEKKENKDEIINSNKFDNANKNQINNIKNELQDKFQNITKSINQEKIDDITDNYNKINGEKLYIQIIEKDNETKFNITENLLPKEGKVQKIEESIKKKYQK